MGVSGIGLVVARSGSKGFPGKNIALLKGRPMLEYAINTGNASSLLGAVYISTDSKHYESIALGAGAVSFGLRKDELATDDSKTIDVVCDFIRGFAKGIPDYVVLLQPTSPIRTAQQIDECIRLHQQTGESVVSVAKVEEPHPCKLQKIDGSGVLRPFLEGESSERPRQDLPTAYQLTGAIYVASSTHILKNRSFFSSKTIPYITEKFVNIDSKDDFDYLNYLLDRGRVSLQPENDSREH